ncbi:hypothetical protein T069G_01551 [Trichoderma breve]|uniref:Uncharacterized protein n=1 Tax=Trichoderma breve TaxID=2034170 RepID=A0A9W9JS39_9HYPO|nr:hypothetical protein T069G_01551 [Trichoderma breve]KAJ4865021.1 hypothetical protein T069G_01551 [Trichoderma breve]
MWNLLQKKPPMDLPKKHDPGPPRRSNQTLDTFYPSGREWARKLLYYSEWETLPQLEPMPEPEPELKEEAMVLEEEAGDEGGDEAEEEIEKGSEGEEEQDEDEDEEESDA